MIQIFFFMSMIGIAALLINMFWSISDSHDKEYLIMCQIRRRSIIRKRQLVNLNGGMSSERYNYSTGSGTVRSVSNINIAYNNNDSDKQSNVNTKSNIYNFNNSNNANRVKVLRKNKIVQFYDLGTPKYNDNYIESHKNDCA